MAMESTPFFSARSLDDLLRLVYKDILENGRPCQATKGPNVEVEAYLLELKNPRARLSRSETRGKLFSALGELAWYLAGSDEPDFIGYYIPEYHAFAENGVIPGAYGPRLFGASKQFEQVIGLLHDRDTSRRAVISLFNERDLQSDKKDIPCTCTIQFLLRDSSLNCIVTMRSNDAVIGLPHDIFCFTMLQEIAATQLNVDLGWYRHFVGSLHMYEKDIPTARYFLDEGLFNYDKAMPPMETVEPLESFLAAEKRIRAQRKRDWLPTWSELPAYWQDLIRLLLAFAHRNEPDRLSELRKSLNDTYSIYLDDKWHRSD